MASTAAMTCTGGPRNGPRRRETRATRAARRSSPARSRKHFPARRFPGNSGGRTDAAEKQPRGQGYELEGHEVASALSRDRKANRPGVERPPAIYSRSRAYASISASSQSPEHSGEEQSGHAYALSKSTVLTMACPVMTSTMASLPSSTRCPPHRSNAATRSGEGPRTVINMDGFSYDSRMTAL